MLFAPKLKVSVGVTLALIAVVPLVAQDRTLLYGVSDLGVSKTANWGLDTAWYDENNVRRGGIFMGSNNVDIVRISFTTSDALVAGQLGLNQLNILTNRLTWVGRWANPTTTVCINEDSPTIAAWYYDGSVVNATNWAANIVAHAKRAKEWGRTVVAVAPFNEPDLYRSERQADMQKFYDTTGFLITNPIITTNNIRISGGNTLNTDSANPWYNFLKARLDEGNTHQLAGTFDNFASFFQNVAASGDHGTDDELHNVMEAMVGVEYGMNTGIWWGTAERARGEFVKASDGKRLAYAEHRGNWTAASVYRGTNGAVQAFVGESERQAQPTTYRFFSKDRDVFYDGDGPRRDFTLATTGGSGYQTAAHRNAERVVNVTWGADVPPLINGRYLIVNRNSGRVLQVPGSSQANGVQLTQNSHTNGLNQQWDVNPLPNTMGGDYSYFTLRAAHSGVTVDLNGFSYNNGGAIQQWNGGTNVVEQWYLQYTANGYFKIRSRWSNKVMAVNGASTANGAPIVQWDDSSSLDQQWRLIPTNATVEFVAPPAVGGVSATAHAVSVQVNWNASAATDLAGYTVLRSTTNGGPYEVIARGLTNTTFTDKFANQPQPYYYVVKAVDRSLNASANSASASATPTGNPALIARYPFDTSLKDLSVNANHPIVTNGTPGLAGSPYGCALDLDGVSQSVLLPANLLASVTNFTLACWVYWDGGGDWQRIFDFGNDTSQYLFLTPRSGNGTLRFALKNGGAEQIVETSALPTNQWRHVTITRNGNTGRLYTNGVLAATAATTIAPASFNPALNYLGKSQFDADPRFNGRLDDLQIYNYALSDAEVLALTSYPTYPPVKLTGGVIGSPGSWSNQGNTITNVFDGNFNTFYDAANASGDWVGLDLGSTQTVAQVKYAPRAASGSRMVGGVFQAANVADFSSGVVTLFTIPTAPPSGVLTTQPIATAGSYRYVRYLGPTDGYCNVAELEFYRATSATPPAAPANLAATAGNALAELSWNPVAGAASYYVKRALSSGGPFTTVANVATTNFTNTGLANGSTYYYAISTFSVGGEGTNSLAVSVTPVSPTPVWLTNAVSGGTLTLTWPADHTGWRLQVQTNTLATGINTNWSDVPGSTATNSVNQPLDANSGSVFYRLVYP